ncbi:MAG TPA: nucleoside hydrolase [Candidatus Glassbacteria bacterium]|nr:nucleoside hydrolase [Candidatus Glassbacteria bacterium]
MINVIYDMETNDPDDAFTLCLLAGHPEVNLLGVTIVPGSTAQVSLVKHILKLLDKPDVFVGGRKPDHPKTCVSGFHYKWLGDKIPEAEQTNTPAYIFKFCYNTAPKLMPITGAPLHNLFDFVQEYQPEIDTWVAQGGFAGCDIIPEEQQLEKFRGKKTCATFNLGGNKKASLALVNYGGIKNKFFVSKDICHSMIYDQEMHERIAPFRHNNVGIKMIYEGMSVYLNKKSEGKKFHDPLAACVAIDRSICKFKEVELYRHKGEWGSRESGNPNANISVAVDREKFEKVLVGK